MKTCKECERKYYAKGYCQVHYMRVKRLGKTTLDKPTHCKSCGTPGHYSKGFCQSCYFKQWKLNKQKEESMNSRGKMEYDEDIHLKQGTPWSNEDVEYLCKFIEVDSIRDLSFALERTEASIERKLQCLRESGKLKYYKKSYERKLSD